MSSDREPERDELPGFARSREARDQIRRYLRDIVEDPAKADYLRAEQARAESEALEHFLVSRTPECSAEAREDLKRRLVYAAQQLLTAQPTHSAIVAAAEHAWSVWSDEAERVFEDAAHGEPPFATARVGFFDALAAPYVAALDEVWPVVLTAWREAQEASRVVMVPAPLVIGDGNLASMFGRRFRALAGRPDPGFEIHKESEDGRVKRIVLKSNQRQLSLLTKDTIRLVNPGAGEIVEALAKVLDNGVWRTFLCCLAAAQEDSQNGAAPAGAFLYTPGRLCTMRGLRREANGKGVGRFTSEHVNLVQGHVDTLGLASFEATVSIGGRAHRVIADKVVYYAEVSVDGPPPKRRGAGRPRAMLYRINDALLQLLAPERGAWWLPIHRAALAPPDGVAQTTWDDALKVYLLLTAKARAEAQAAKAEDALPWQWRLDTLLEQANIAGEARPVRLVRHRGRELLAALESAGLATYGIEGEGEEARVSYTLPRARPVLATVSPQLASGKPRPPPPRRAGRRAAL